MFQFLINGEEICKAYSELVDPIIQRRTLEEQAKAKAMGDPNRRKAVMQEERDKQIAEAQEIQYAADAIIYKMCSCHGNMYAVIKEIIKIREGLELGSVRKPLAALIPEDMATVNACVDMINEAIAKYC